MSALPGPVQRALLLRSLLIQGSWNYETLIGTGFAFVLLPALRYLFGGDSDALKRALARHTGVFNSHPYLATVAIGAVTHLEAEGTDPVMLERFKVAIRSSLGSIGDQLVWQTWRPAVALLAIALLLVGAPWWLAVAVFLLAYNALHFWLRVWGLRAGLEAGIRVGNSLRDAPFRGWGPPTADVGALLAGFCFGVALLRVPGGTGDVAFVAVAAVAGFWLGVRARFILWVALLVVWLLGTAVGGFSEMGF